MNKIKSQLSIIALLIFAFAQIITAQTTAFTYQGKLTDSAMQANGTYDLGFALYDQPTGGTQIGAALTRANVTVTNGIFTVSLDFGANAFPGANRYLQIAVKRPADADYTTLTPRQPVTSTPYAIRALSAATADAAATATTATTATNAQQLGGTAASGFVQTDSTAFVRNQTTQQTSSNFNIDGTGTANIFNAATQFNIGGNRVLFTDGDGGANTFAGLRSGRVNDTGSLNFFGGYVAGSNNTSGSSNSFVGAQSGQANTTGSFNAYFGRFTGNRNTTGELNSFFGAESGTNNTTGILNSFFGENAGSGNTVGGSNTALGAYSSFGANNLNYATAIGSNARVSSNDTIVIGKTAGTYSGVARPADAVQIPGALTVTGTINGTVTNATNSAQLGGTAAANFVQTNDARLSDARTPTAGSANYIQNTTAQQASSNFNVSGSGTAGGTLSGNSVNSATQFTIGGNGKLRIDSSSNILVGTLRQSYLGGEPNVGGSNNSFFGNITGGGFNTPNDNLGFDTTGSNNTLVGANTSTGSPSLDYATAIGAGARVNTSNTIVLGRPTQGQDQVVIAGNVNIGGVLQVSLLGAGPGVTLCRNNSTGQLSLCSSSIRYKTNVADFAFGLSLINKLRPVTFDWKADGTRDVGFIAEEVNAVEPLLTIYNDKGQVEGVKYDRFGALFVNAFKEQQTQIERQQKQIDEQKLLIDALKTLICSQNPGAVVCK